eukprot:6264915-Pyramimonas_sp.AAC.1
MQRKRDRVLVPPRQRNSIPAQSEHTPSAYIAFEGKCFNRETGDPCCPKPHAHVRELVSGVHATQK